MFVRAENKGKITSVMSVGRKTHGAVRDVWLDRETGRTKLSQQARDWRTVPSAGPGGMCESAVAEEARNWKKTEMLKDTASESRQWRGPLEEDVGEVPPCRSGGGLGSKSIRAITMFCSKVPGKRQVSQLTLWGWCYPDTNTWKEWHKTRKP